MLIATMTYPRLLPKHSPTPVRRLSRLRPLGWQQGCRNIQLGSRPKALPGQMQSSYGTATPTRWSTSPRRASATSANCPASRPEGHRDKDPPNYPSTQGGPNVDGLRVERADVRG